MEEVPLLAVTTQVEDISSGGSDQEDWLGQDNALVQIESATQPFGHRVLSLFASRSKVTGGSQSSKKEKDRCLVDPLLRCSKGRSCIKCQIQSCTRAKVEPKCKACLSEVKGSICNRKEACEHWTPVQIVQFTELKKFHNERSRISTPRTTLLPTDATMASLITTEAETGAAERVSLFDDIGRARSLDRQPTSKQMADNKEAWKQLEDEQQRRMDQAKLKKEGQVLQFTSGGPHTVPVAGKTLERTPVTQPAKVTLDQDLVSTIRGLKDTIAKHEKELQRMSSLKPKKLNFNVATTSADKDRSIFSEPVDPNEETREWLRKRGLLHREEGFHSQVSGDPSNLLGIDHRDNVEGQHTVTEVRASDSSSDDESGLKNDERRRQQRRRSRARSPQNLTLPLAALMTQVQQIATTLKDSSSPSTTTRSKLPPIHLPSPRRQTDGSVSCIEFHTWIGLLKKMEKDLKVDPAEIHMRLASDPKILPVSGRQTMQESSTLHDGLEALKLQYPPVSSCYPSLIQELLGGDPSDGSDEAVIVRTGELLQTIHRLQELVPERDLSREQALLALSNVSCSSDMRTELMTKIRDWDRRKNADPTLFPDDHRPYLESLRRYLSELRKSRTDLHSALTSLRPPLPPQATSFNSTVESNRKEPRMTRVTSRTTTPNNTSQTCGFKSCQSKNHPTFKCLKGLSLLKEKKIPFPDNHCKKCLKKVTVGERHPSDCFQLNWNVDGKQIKVDLRCPIHKIVNYRACNTDQCSQKTSSPFPRQSTKPRVNQLLSLPKLLSSSKDKFHEVAIPRVNFMSELIQLRGKDGQMREALISYDSHSGISLVQNMDENFNYAEKDQCSESFFMNTVNSSAEYQLPVAKVKMIAKGRHCFEPILFKSQFPESTNQVTIAKELLDACRIDPPPQVSCDTIRILLGEDHSVQHPRRMKMPKLISDRYPQLCLSKSQLTGRLLISGNGVQSSTNHFMCDLKVSEQFCEKDEKVETVGTDHTGM